MAGSLCVQALTPRRRGRLSLRLLAQPVSLVIIVIAIAIIIAVLVIIAIAVMLLSFLFAP